MYFNMSSILAFIAIPFILAVKQYYWLQIQHSVEEKHISRLDHGKNVLEYNWALRESYEQMSVDRISLFAVLLNKLLLK